MVDLVPVELELEMERKRQDESGMINDEHSKRPRLEESQCAVNSAYTSEVFKKEIRAAWQ